MFVKKICVRLSVLLLAFFSVTASSIVMASSETQTQFVSESLPLLQSANPLWTKNLVESWLATVDEQCGSRGMQIFLDTVRGNFVESNRQAITFACPIIALAYEQSKTAVFDPSVFVSDFSLAQTVDGKIAKKAQADLLAKAITKASPFFKKAGGWVRDTAWPAVQSFAKWLGDAAGKAAAADYIQRKTCEYTHNWC